MTKKFSRIILNVSVGYGEDLGKVMNTVNVVCKEMAEDKQFRDMFITRPSAVRVNSLGDSGIDILKTGDVIPGQQWAPNVELRLRIKNAFDDTDIEIPWPHTKVYFGNSLESVSKN